MKREQLTALLTTGVLTGALAVIAARNKGMTMSDLNPAFLAESPVFKSRTPEDSIYAMLDAAKAGNVNGYLECYTGPIQDTLRHSATESTQAGFEKYLRKSDAAIQGVALSPAETLTGSEVKVRIEYVYKDRNEVQFLYLRKAGAGWKIYQVDSAARIQTLVPYGAAVTD